MTIKQDDLNDIMRAWVEASATNRSAIAREIDMEVDHFNKFMSGSRQLKANEFVNLHAYMEAHHSNLRPVYARLWEHEEQEVRELTYVSIDDEHLTERMAISDGRRHNIPSDAIPQVEGTIGAGYRDDIEMLDIGLGNGTSVSAVPVVGLWNLPKSVLHRRVSTSAANLHFIECEGNSMDPLIKDGDVVLIDKSRRSPAMPGVFALWEDDGQTIKQVEIVRGSDPLKLRLIPANKDYSAYDRLASEIRIIGRYVARFTVD